MQDSRISLAGRIQRRPPFVKHQVNEHAGDRNVKPDRHGPLPDATMFIPAFPERRHERDDDQRQHRKRQQDVRDQDREVNRPNESKTAELRAIVRRARRDR